ncbi:MAG: hypothetical protein IT562_21570 [Alphaproteobacteria bacterium]|nr:hypothetical protein [Alphaproteobacteria bacterium]
MANLVKLSISTIAFGASSAALALGVAMAGLWLIGLTAGIDSSAVHLAAIQ